MFNRDLNNILKTFTKVQTQLDTFISKTEATAADKSKAAGGLIEEAARLTSEAQRAAKVRENIANIVG